MFIERFINFIQYEKRYSGHTLAAYSHEIRRFIDYLGKHNSEVDKITHREARSYLAALLEEGQSPTSINRSLSALRTYYKFLMRESSVSQNPFSLVKALKTPKKLPVTVDKDKLSSLLDMDGVFPDSFEGIRDK